MQKVFGFSDNCIWIGCGKFSLLQREHSSLVVNVLITFAQQIVDELIKTKMYAIEDTNLCSNYTQEKFSSTWMKENMGIHAKNIPEKMEWNGIIANNK